MPWGSCSELQICAEQTWCRIPYTMEVMKGGQIVEQRSIGDRAFLRFGRSPTNEVHALAWAPH